MFLNNHTHSDTDKVSALKYTVVGHHTRNLILAVAQQVTFSMAVSRYELNLSKTHLRKYYF